MQFERSDGLPQWMWCVLHRTVDLVANSRYA